MHIFIFQTTLNNAEMSCEHIQTLKTNIEDEVNKLYGQVNDQSKAKLQVFGKIFWHQIGLFIV